MFLAWQTRASTLEQFLQCARRETAHFRVTAHALRILPSDCAVLALLSIATSIHENTADVIKTLTLPDGQHKAYIWVEGYVSGPLMAFWLYQSNPSLSSPVWKLKLSRVERTLDVNMFMFSDVPCHHNKGQAGTARTCPRDTTRFLLRMELENNNYTTDAVAVSCLIYPCLRSYYG